MTKNFDDLVEQMKSQATAPESVTARIDDALGALPARATTAATTGATASPTPQLTAIPGKRSTRRPWRWAAAGVAACAALTACLVAAPALTGGAGDDQAPAGSLAETLGGTFAVRQAFGAEVEGVADGSVLAFGDRGMGSAGAETGAFLASTFAIEGANIATVSAQVSTGQLFRMTQSELTEDQMASLLDGGALEGIGFTHEISGEEEGTGPYLDQYCVAAGSSFTEDYDPAVSYGFYLPGETVAALDQDDPKAFFWSLYDQFDGATLSITVTYTDGSQESRTYDLASGKLKAVEDPEGAWPVVTQQFVSNDGEPFCYGLLATLHA